LAPNESVSRPLAAPRRTLMYPLMHGTVSGQYTVRVCVCDMTRPTSSDSAVPSAKWFGRDCVMAAELGMGLIPLGLSSRTVSRGNLSMR